MTATQSRLLGVALLVAAVSVVLYLKGGRDTAADASADRIRQVQLEEETARARARFDAGAYIAMSKQLTDREDLQVIVIPEGYSEELDTRCIVYQNTELRTSSIDCSGVKFRRGNP